MFSPLHIFLLPAAYLDPGSGSLIIQVLLAVALGGGYLVKVYWKKIKAFFSGKKGDTAALLKIELSVDTDSGDGPTASPYDPSKPEE